MQYIGEAMRSNSCGEVSPTVVKGNRTKRRQRGILPSPSAVVSRAATSSASSAESMSATTEEDEDMANCLILLARGGAISPPAEEKFARRRFTEGTTVMTGKAEFYVNYECKTCNRHFPSFQALGGHRTSHKKPKIVLPAAETIKILNDNTLPISIASSIERTMIHNNNGKNKLKVHECSICGSEFRSGQALGGHMRRHRMIAISPKAHDPIPKGRSFLSSLDLNLPAPCDDDSEELESLSLSLTLAGERPIAFSAGTAPVGCHF